MKKMHVPTKSGYYDLHYEDGTFAPKDGDDKKEEMSSPSISSFDALSDFSELTGSEFGETFDGIFDEMFGDLPDDLKDFDPNKEKYLALTSEQKKVIDELTLGKAEKTLMNAFPELDINKIIDLPEEDIKKILEAELLLRNTNNPDIDDEILSELETQIENLRANKLGEKFRYRLGEFDEESSFYYCYKKILGEEYGELMDKIDERKEEIKENRDNWINLISKYENPEYPYSYSRKKKATICDCEDQVDEAFEKKAQEVIKSLTALERKVANFYTSSFSIINEPLRKKMYKGSKSLPLSNFTDTINNLTSAIDKSKIDFDFKVSRGLYNIKISDAFALTAESTYKDLQKCVGMVFKDDGFCSTSALYGDSFSGKYTLNIYCPKGTKGLFVKSISDYPEENEILLQRGYEYKITGFSKDNNNHFVIDCELVLDSDNDKYSYEELEEIGSKYFEW